MLPIYFKPPPMYPLPDGMLILFRATDVHPPLNIQLIPPPLPLRHATAGCIYLMEVVLLRKTESSLLYSNF